MQKTFDHCFPKTIIPGGIPRKSHRSESPKDCFIIAEMEEKWIPLIGSEGRAGSEGSTGVVRRIKIRKRRGVLKIWYSRKTGNL